MYATLCLHAERLFSKFELVASKSQDSNPNHATRLTLSRLDRMAQKNELPMKTNNDSQFIM